MMEMTVGTDQSEINELFGISFRYHHSNSARIGWRYVHYKFKATLIT